MSGSDSDSVVAVATATPAMPAAEQQVRHRQAPDAEPQGHGRALGVQQRADAGEEPDREQHHGAHREHPRHHPVGVVPVGELLRPEREQRVGETGAQGEDDAERVDGLAVGGAGGQERRRRRAPGRWRAPSGGRAARRGRSSPPARPTPGPSPPRPPCRWRRRPAARHRRSTAGRRRWPARPARAAGARARARPRAAAPGSPPPPAARAPRPRSGWRPPRCCSPRRGRGPGRCPSCPTASPPPPRTGAPGGRWRRARSVNLFALVTAPL